MHPVTVIASTGIELAHHASLPQGAQDKAPNPELTSLHGNEV